MRQRLGPLGSGFRSLSRLAVALCLVSGVALPVVDVPDVGYATAPSFTLTSVQASLLPARKVGFQLMGFDPSHSALTLRASCVWDPGTGSAIETVDFGTGKIASKSFCAADPWVQDVPCTLVTANGTDPEMEKLRQRMAFGWPMSARVLYGERSKVQAALENAGPPAAPTHPRPTPKPR